MDDVTKIQIGQAEIEFYVPKNLVNFSRDFDKFLDRLIERSGVRIRDILKETIKKEDVYYTGRMHNQVARTKIQTEGDNKYVEVGIMGDRAIIGQYLENGTRGAMNGYIPFDAIKKWANRKKIALGLGPKERMKILRAIWMKIGKHGVYPRHFMDKAAQAAEPVVEEFVASEINRLVSKFNGGGNATGE